MTSPLDVHIGGVLAPEKFQTMDAKFGYRVVHQPVSPCPHDATGCPTCKMSGATPGKHARKFARAAFTDTFTVRDDGGPLILAHRELVTPLTLTLPDGTELAEGVDYVRDGREVTFLREIERRTKLGVAYEALAESWVHLQHAFADFAGAGRRAEYSLNMAYANLEQGLIAMSIPANAHGYHCKPGDRYIPIDARIRFSMTLDRGRQNVRARHKFVRGIVEAYGVNRDGQEVELTATWNQAQNTISVSGAEYEKAVVVYDACPVYSVYLDMGEFRHPAGGDHHRLVLLIRDEVSR